MPETQENSAMPKPFYQGITDFIFVQDSPEPSEVIFVPGGSYPQAAQHAARLYRQGMALFLLPSGKYSKVDGIFAVPEGADPRDWPPEKRRRYTEWRYLSEILRENGVPGEAILREDEATYTWENAIFSRRLLEERSMVPKQAIICCQAFHARRCLTYYQQQFPETRLLICPVITRGISREDWHLDPEKTRTVLGEVARCGEQFACMLPEDSPLGYP